MGRIVLAFRCFFQILFHGRVEPELAPRLLGPGEAKPPEPEAPAAVDAMRLLAILQREGRLVDFLREDVAPFSDAQVGAAARSVHAGCRRVLEEYLELAPAHAGEEGSAVTVESGYDPSAVRLVGDVKGVPPFRGRLAHHGWRATRIDLPPLPAGQDPRILAPAEVEVGAS